MFGKFVIYPDGSEEDPYLTRWIVGRLRLHKFHRPDGDKAPHDHPWDFWTFPLVSYVEEVFDPQTGKTIVHVVERFKVHYRPAVHCHRILGKWSGLDQRHGYKGPLPTVGPIWTIVWTGPVIRKWGFYSKGMWYPWRMFSNRKKQGLE